MQSEPRWLTPGEVIDLNQRVVAATGEPFGLLSPELLESALGSPQSHWVYEEENDAVSLAVTLLFALARNHPFEQGNKRTGFEAALIFLMANGYTYDDDLPDSEELAHLITAVIAHERNEADFDIFIRPHIIPLNDE